MPQKAQVMNKNRRSRVGFDVFGTVDIKLGAHESIPCRCWQALPGAALNLSLLPEARQLMKKTGGCIQTVASLARCQRPRPELVPANPKDS